MSDQKIHLLTVIVYLGQIIIITHVRCCINCNNSDMFYCVIKKSMFIGYVISAQFNLIFC